MDLLGDIGGFLSESLLGGKGGGGGLLSGNNLLLGGLGILNFLNQDAENDRLDASQLLNEEIADRQLDLAESKFDFDREANKLDRAFAAQKLQSELALAQIANAIRAQSANQQAGVQAEQIAQNALANQANTRLSGGNLASSALGSLLASAQAPLLR